MNPFRFDISLRIFHPHMDPADICDALGLSPSRQWKAGEPRTTPTGATMEGVRRETYCTFQIARGDNGELAEAIAKSIALLEPRSAFLTSVTQDGGRAEYFIGWYVNDSAGETFPAGLLRQLGRLDIDLAVCVYSDNRAKDLSDPSADSSETGPNEGLGTIIARLFKDVGLEEGEELQMRRPAVFDPDAD